MPETTCFETISLCSRTWASEHHATCLCVHRLLSCVCGEGKILFFAFEWSCWPSEMELFLMASGHIVAPRCLFPLRCGWLPAETHPMWCAEEQSCCLTMLHLDSPGLLEIMLIPREGMQNWPRDRNVVVQFWPGLCFWDLLTFWLWAFSTLPSWQSAPILDPHL